MDSLKQNDNEQAQTSTLQGAPAPSQPESSPYPPGFEPELEGEELERAIAQEKRYRWLVRFEIAFLLVIVAVVIYFIFTS